MKDKKYKLTVEYYIIMFLYSFIMLLFLINFYFQNKINWMIDVFFVGLVLGIIMHIVLKSIFKEPITEIIENKKVIKYG